MNQLAEKVTEEFRGKLEETRTVDDVSRIMAYGLFTRYIQSEEVGNWFESELMLKKNTLEYLMSTVDEETWNGGHFHYCDVKKHMRKLKRKLQFSNQLK